MTEPKTGQWPWERDPEAWQRAIDEVKAVEEADREAARIKEAEALSLEFVNQAGIWLCSLCRNYDMAALQNCALGYVAPSDCPLVLKTLNLIVKEYEEAEKQWE